MKNTIIFSAVFSILSLSVYAGGDPEFVLFQPDYTETDTQYVTINRQNDKQVAVLYANDSAINSIRYGDRLIPGSRITMEIYKVLKDADGNKLTGSDGIYQKGDLAAVAVMEKSLEWDQNFESDHRASDWGFAIYQPNGEVKKNDLDCAACHTPLNDTDFMFTHAHLKAAANK